MKKIIFLALGCSLLFTPSCKDYLQKNPTSSLTEVVFWQTKADFNMALAGLYNFMKGYGNWYNSTTYAYSYGFFGSIRSKMEDLSDNGVGGNYADQVEDILQDALTPATGGYVSNIYSFCYMGIARNNTFLERLEERKSLFTTEEYNKHRGEALAMRAMYYNYLYICYGAVPIVKEALTVDNMYKEKSTKEEVYKAIVDDYTEAISLLPDGLSYKQDAGHMTKYAAIALRAKTKLYHAYDEKGVANTAEMAEILTELKQIPDGIYSVEADPLTNFHASTQENSNEIMFSAKFLAPTMRNQMDLYYGDWCEVAPTRDLVYAFPNADGTPYVPDPALEKQLADTSVTVRTAALNKLFENRDMRLKKFITHSNHWDFTEYIPSDANDVRTKTVISPTHFNVFKLVTPRTNNQAWDYDWYSDQDRVLMRWGEVLLMKAEAALESGNNAEAMGYINDLRSPRGIAVLTSIDRDILRNEIRIETCLEGQRYFDMKRWRILDKMNGKPRDPAMAGSFNVVINPAHFDWPIPLNEIIKAQENGVNLEQNPGYTTK